jgi:DNA-binding response OmpR family regulator
MKTAAIVDDDVYIGDMLSEVLGKNGYSVLRAYSGTEAVMLLSSKTPDIILLDLMLPGLSGEEVMAKIKDIPVIILSAKTDPDDKVKLLLDGACDYITKPFDTKELLARMSVALRNSNKSAAVQRYGGITLNGLNHTVKVNETELKLTRTEYAILKYLMQNSEQVVSKSQLLERISADTPDCTENSLKIHVSNLRKKLRDASGKDYIEAVWGIGYKL